MQCKFNRYRIREVGLGTKATTFCLDFFFDDVLHRYLAYVFTVCILFLVFMRLAQQRNHFFLPKIFIIVQYEMAFISVSDPDNFMF
jgi:hypothetical protein